MSLEIKISADLKAAMLAKNETALRALRAVKSAILLAKTSGAGTEMKAEDEIKLLQKLVKQRKESAEIFSQQNRADLAQNETDELLIIEKYLPAQMSADEIKAAVAAAIASTGAASPADMGKVMGIVSKQLAGKADNKLVADMVKQMLALKAE